MDFEWGFFIDLGIISIALLIATLIRARVPFFQKYLIPNALTAGFLILPFYNFVAKEIGMGKEGLGTLVYHLLAISFISVSLKRGPRYGARGDLRIYSTSVGIISQYSLQALIGLLLTFLFMKTFFPDLFPAFGLLVPLGFALGPGQAFAIAREWESLGFSGASTIGLTFAAIGFLWACFGGMFLINYAIRKGWMTRKEIEAIKDRDTKTGIHPKSAGRPEGGKLVTESEAIDSMTYHLAHVLFVYLLTYLFLKLVTWPLGRLNGFAEQIVTNLWGIGFIFGAMTALLYKKVLKALRIDFTLDNGSLTRITGISVDVMVTAAVAAISISVIAKYWVPIVILCVLAGIVAIVTIPWICSRLFKDHRFQRTLIIYGVSTGTMPTGLALLRVIDPEFATPVAAEYMYATGLTFLIAIPFFLSIPLPAYSAITGNPLYFWLAVAVSFAYLLFVVISYFFITRKRGIKDPSDIWLKK